MLDLAGVSFMDSSGINILIAAHQALTETGGWLRLAGAHGPVLRVMELVGIDTLIDCHPTPHHALTDCPLPTACVPARRGAASDPDSGLGAGPVG
ncbi:STAS domain-containing protein [Streptomyces griseoloalbus]|uniref:STAS domain-containing protein n=1 Tax=Streptomyces griseoloalbus TaxID=67303 RepID=UPI003F53F725